MHIQQISSVSDENAMVVIVAVDFFGLENHLLVKSSLNFSMHFFSLPDSAHRVLFKYLNGSLWTRPIISLNGGLQKRMNDVRQRKLMLSSIYADWLSTIVLCREHINYRVVGFWERGKSDMLCDFREMLMQKLFSQVS